MEGNSALSPSHQSKKMMQTSADRLSELPESIIHHIFSHLDMKEVVQTSLLSSTWRFTWQSSSGHSLSFDHSSWKTLKSSSKRKHQHRHRHGASASYRGSHIVFRKRGFMDFVDRFLLDDPLSPTTLNKLSINCGEFCENNRVNKWINAAVELHVRELYLEACNRPTRNFPKSRSLPMDLFTGDITKFTFKSKFIPVERGQFGTIRLPQSIGLATQLRSLELESAQLPQVHNSEKKFILKCPILENLVIHNCDHHDLKLLKISAAKLKSLVIKNDDAKWVGQCKIKIRAPELTSFSLLGFFYKSFDVGNLPSVVSANVRVSGGANLPSVVSANVRVSDGASNLPSVFGGGVNLPQCPRVQHLIKVLNCVSNVTTLELHNCSSELPDFHDILDAMPDPFCNLKCLKLMWGGNSCMQVITDLLKSSQIETLVLQVTKAFSTRDWEHDLSFKWMFCHLRFVEIQNFIKAENESRLLKTLIENAMVLEKVTLRLSLMVSFCKQKEMARISQWLLSLPKASTGFKIRFLD